MTFEVFEEPRELGNEIIFSDNLSDLVPQPVYFGATFLDDLQDLLLG